MMSSSKFSLFQLKVGLVKMHFGLPKIVSDNQLTGFVNGHSLHKWPIHCKGSKGGLDKEIFLQDLWGSGTSGMSPVC